MSVSDETIARASQGERAAQRDIYETFGERVHNIVSRIVGESDADDVFQDAFIHLLANLKSFQHKSSFKTWMHRVVVNQALQHKRKSKRPIATTVPLPEQEILHLETYKNQTEDAEILQLAFAKIDPQLRKILELKEIDELPYSDIARIVEIPVGTVGSRLNRARKELKTQLLNLGWEQ